MVEETLDKGLLGYYNLSNTGEKSTEVPIILKCGLKIIHEEVRHFMCKIKCG